MAREPLEERVYKFLLERGGQGASSAELASTFLGVGAMSEQIAKRVVEPVISRDRRVAIGKDGMWRAVPRKVASLDFARDGSGSGVHTVVEFCFASGGNGESVAVECGVAQVEGGKAGESRAIAVQPDQALATGAQLPPGLSRSDLQTAPPLVKILERLFARASGTTLTCYEMTPLHKRVCHGSSGEIASLSIKHLARRMELIGRDATIVECAEALGIVCPEQPRAGELAAVSAEMLMILIAQLQEMGISGHDQVADFLRPPHIEVDFSRYDFDWAFLDTLPEEPGVYVMKDANGAPIYVGKATNLRKRVTSYFRRTVRLDERIERIRERVCGLIVERVGSELEALLLEHRQIRDLAPELNVAMEVRERSAGYGGPKNVIIVLPSRAAGHVELFMLRAEELQTLRVPIADPEAAREAVEQTYFSPASQKTEESDAEILNLVRSWLERNKDKANAIDVNASGDLNNLMRLLKDYAADAGAAVRAFRA